MIFKTVSIVVPIFNEEDYIEKAVKRIIESDTLGMKKEIILIDDGSTDSTPVILKRIEKSKKSLDIKILLQKINEGKGASLKKAFQKTSGEIVIIQDADLEYSPLDYPKLLTPFFENDVDVVYGSRLVTSAPHRVLYFWHYIINKLLTTISNIFTNLNLTDMETGYKVFRGDLIRSLALKLESKRFGFEPEITARISKIKGIKIYEVGISYSGRTYEEGKKIGWKDGIKTFWQIFKYNLLVS